jgi:hemoglobin
MSRLAEKKLESNLYSQLGGEVVLRQFVNHLYDFMASSSQVEHVRKMHSKNLSFASDRLFMFLSGMLGGPPLYEQEFGHPRLRRKHLQFSIGDEERDQWLTCAQYAANQLHVEPDVRKELMSVLTTMANHLRNQNNPVQQCEVIK